MHRSIRPQRLAAAVAVVFSIALASAACETTRNMVPDQLPTVTLTSGPIDTVSAPQSWLVDIGWTGTDPDGRIDHYEYAIDPPRLKQARFALAETAWVKTNENHVVALVNSSVKRNGKTYDDHQTFIFHLNEQGKTTETWIVSDTEQLKKSLEG